MMKASSSKQEIAHDTPGSYLTAFGQLDTRAQIDALAVGVGHRLDRADGAVRVDPDPVADQAGLRIDQGGRHPVGELRGELDVAGARDQDRRRAVGWRVFEVVPAP